MHPQHRIDLTQISNNHATDQEPITLHYGQQFTTRQHQRTYSNYPTAASEIMNPQEIHRRVKHEQFLFQNLNNIKQKQEESMKQRNISVHKILTIKQIKQASRNRQKMLQNTPSIQFGQSNQKSKQIELGGRSPSKRVHLSKYNEYHSQDLLPF